MGVPYVLLGGLVSPLGSHVPCEGSVNPMGCPAKGAHPLWGSLYQLGGLISPTGGACAPIKGSHAPGGGPISPIRGSYVPCGVPKVQHRGLTRSRVTSAETTTLIWFHSHRQSIPRGSQALLGHFSPCGARCASAALGL